MNGAIKDRALAMCAATLSTAKLFYKARWSQVREDDVILVPGDEHPIAEVTVKEVHRLRNNDGADLVNVYYRFGYATYGITREPDEAVYIQSRF